MKKQALFLSFLGFIISCQVAIADDGSVAGKKHITATGKVELYREIGMYWYRLHTSDGKVVHLGARCNFLDSVMECLETAEEKGTPVSISGLLVQYKSGDAGMDESTVTCMPVKSAAHFKMTDAKHQAFMMESEEYALADTLLNVTWKRIKSTVPQEQYKKILAEQRSWAGRSRDAAASVYGASMKEIDAYTKVMQDRIAKLCEYIAVTPLSGIYKSKKISSEFTALVQNGKLHISGNANNQRGYLCDFDGEGVIGQKNGWIAVKHDSLPDFYMLFMKDGAEIVYISSETEQGCGIGVGFSGHYKRN